MSSIAPCIWFDGNAEEAARFYANMFPESRIDAVRGAPADFHSGKAGDVIVVEFTILGLPFVGRNGGEEYRLGDGLAFLIRTQSQEETDRYWNAIIDNGGQEGERGRCKDRFGLWWQIVPRLLGELLADADRDSAGRVFAAMMSMRKIDIAELERAAAVSATEPRVMKDQR
jgi:predicted 3-demethylubiquinone-9 3-methyltransferase (glyoxalase superfamily)